MKQFTTVLVLLMSILLLVTFCSTAFSAPTKTAKIVVRGISNDIKKLGRYTSNSTALPNVGKGQKVWLEAQALYSTDSILSHSWIDTILTQDWSVTPPAGGFAQIVHTDTTTYLIPDTTGQYKVDLTVTTANGSSSTTLYINSALWVGVGTIVGDGPDAGKGECGACHSDKAATWANTGHSKVFSFNVDSSTHYSANCITCHTVGYDKSATAVNGGFDDIATQIGFTVPSPQHPGVWDSIKTNFPDLAAKANIQCENCHGPGSLHAGETDNNKMVATFNPEMCGSCHGAAKTHIKTSEWLQSAHAASMAEGAQFSYMNQSACARCHTAQGFVNETIDGNAPAAPYTDAAVVGCAACHDPHDASNPAQLRAKSIATACEGCHITRVSSRGLHHAHQTPMLKGSTGTPWPGTKFTGTLIGTYAGYQFAGYTYPNSSHMNAPEGCATCHMATPTVLADTAMVPLPYSQWQGKLGGHTFKVVWNHDTPDDATDDVLNPLGCKECHGNVSLEFVENTQNKIKTLLEQLRVALPHATSSDTTQPKGFTDASLSPIQQAASYNYSFVLNEGSYGVHNFEYASALLRSSLEMVKLGAGAASIATIKDVPNDQGKQVQVVWNKFPAESYPVDPVTTYLVLRMDSASGMPKAGNTIAASSFTEMLSKVGGGTPVTLAGAVWTKVGEFKAVKLAQYSLVVPTVYDSTITGGQKLTTFEVIGSTAAGVIYASASMAGYSIDNLAPVTPGGLAAKTGTGAVDLTWDNPVDQDFKYFAVYRGTTAGFTPTGTPYATASTPSYTDAAVSNGSTYYYKVSAFDFSGNQSPVSSEVSSLVTGVGEQTGLPKEFGLNQNHPNPFNPSTQIRYQLPSAVHVKISVYNTLGSLVTILVDQEQAAGYYNVTFNGHDKAGNTLATGIYLYKMEAGSFTSIKKMMFVK
jgi:predicted CXXCH cytochrome family protein